MVVTEDSMMTLTISDTPMVISWVFNPTKEKTRILNFGGNTRVYFPSALVVVPEVVPLIKTVTPGIGPLSSRDVTWPVMVLVCATTPFRPMKKNNKKIVKDVLISGGLIICKNRINPFKGETEWLFFRKMNKMLNGKYLVVTGQGGWLSDVTGASKKNKWK